MLVSALVETFAIPRPHPGDLADVAYKSDGGAVTRRRIRVIAVGPSRYGRVYVRAFCFLRREERTFRLDRFTEWTAVAPTTPTVAPPTARWPAATPAPSPPRPPATQPASQPVQTAGRKARKAAAISRSPASRKSRGGYGIGSMAAAALFGVLMKFVFSGPQQDPLVYRTPQFPIPQSLLSAPATARQPSRPAPIRPVVSSPSERMYADADLDHNGSLSWEELKVFQVRLKGSEHYLANDTVLRPDEFLSHGGGDCDDWAEFTCGLLRRWGWEPYIGVFSPPSGTEAHAVCLVRLDRQPARFTYYSIPSGCQLISGTPKPGFYVPVDYEVVGGISNAMGEDWKLEAIYAPESIYGAAM